MKVVLLAGGRGTRISGEYPQIPKPMIEIGGKPILWHIMKEYSYYGHNEFVICSGYRQDYIKKWFVDYYSNNSDIVLDFRNGKNEISFFNQKIEPWKITIIDTGLDTMTGGRVRRIRDYVGDDTFLLTYGDGVCDVNINDLISFHKAHKKTVTITTVKLIQDKGIIQVDGDNAVLTFREKSPEYARIINAGYMVVEPGIFELLDGDCTVLERTPLETLASKGQLMSFFHNGFWQCVDNVRELQFLETLIKNKQAPWMYWD